MNKLKDTVKDEKLQEAVNIRTEEIGKLLPTNLDESSRDSFTSVSIRFFCSFFSWW